MKRRVLLQFGGAAALASLLPLTALARPPLKANKPMSILILGGTGFVGPHLVRHSLTRGHRVTVFNRGHQKIEWYGEVEQLIGDRNTGDLAALKGREWDVCIDVPTTLPKWARDAGELLRDTIGQTIFVSTISAYADNRRANADESAPLAKYRGRDAMAETQDSVRADPGLYGALKTLSEQEVERHFPGKATIIRPGLIVGPGDPTDRFTYWPQRLARGGNVAAPGDGKDPVQFIDVRDLAEWMIHLAEQRTFGVFNALGPGKPMTMSEMLQGIAGAIDSKANLRWIPKPFLQANDIKQWSDMPVWIPREGDGVGFMTRSQRRAVSAGLSYRPLPTTARETHAWFNTLHDERRNKLSAGLNAQREQELLAAWQEASGNLSRAVG